MQVYRGRVSNTMDFGAFIELQGLRQRYEGLVHVSEISKTRPGSAKDVLKRGQEVWVKVLRITATGGKQQVSLSMRDVDQVTLLHLRRHTNNKGIEVARQLSWRDDADGMLLHHERQAAESKATAPQVTGQDLLPHVAAAAGSDRSNPSMPAGGPERSALHGLSGISRTGLEAAEEVRGCRRLCISGTRLLISAQGAHPDLPYVYHAWK
jgi:predicted RNA-binding protein with RPS1 domain